ncbi:MAG: hypothetical protein JWO12_1107 [Frankiales bacterium]|nr:hypothetical protein [Frankiales bacterium]
MRRVLLAVVSTVTGLVMLLSFKTHAVVPAGAAASEVAPATPAASASSTTTTTTPKAVTSAVTKTVTGDSVDTRWGPVQVKITVTSGKITSAVAVVYPQSNGRDQEINSYAVPTLQQETVTANSASIDMVSGATYTSNGYIQSLQSALNKV